MKLTFKQQGKIPRYIIDIANIFNSNGYDLFLVGGSVRDLVVGRDPKDYDLATNALPEDMMSFLKEKYEFKYMGKAFGVLVIYDNAFPEGMEIATFREDLSVGRNPEVKIGTTIDKDVLRRDLTMNALFVNLSNMNIIDLVGGISDLKNGICRMVGNPIDRINEDKLRILRVARFAAVYDAKVDAATLSAIRSNNKLTEVSKERMFMEFNAAFKKSKNFKSFIDYLSAFNIWSEIFEPEFVKDTYSNFKNCSTLGLVYSQLWYKPNIKLDRLTKKAILDWKIPAKYVDQAVFYISLLNDVNNIDLELYYKLKKKQEQLAIQNVYVMELFKIFGINSKLATAFANSNLSIKADYVIDKYNLDIDKDGREIGIRIKEEEYNKFRNKL